MHYRKLLKVINDLSQFKCDSCNSSLNLYKFSVNNDFENADAVMLCFKCGLQYEFKVLGIGAFGLREVKKIKASSWSEFFKFIEEIK
ncbi:MAG: hypothetical protein N3E39_00905 [Candidatus Methanomethylicia archaeon]|nr:hypothetical protein [Candidatus Methanomethylicia archaeon]MDW7988506.1 hypothetical protein [Nitrososphaerota archaeon]